MSPCDQLMSQPVPKGRLAGEHCRLIDQTVAWIRYQCDRVGQLPSPDLLKDQGR